MDRSLWEDKRQFRSPCNKCASAKALGGGDTQAAVSNRAGITVCSRCLVQLKRSRVHSLCPSNLWANFTVLIILRILSICQTHFMVFESGRLQGSHLWLITHDLV